MERLSGSAARLRRRNDFQRKHNLSGLPPEQMFVTAEAVKGKSRQSGQAQEAVSRYPFLHRN